MDVTKPSHNMDLGTFPNDWEIFKIQNLIDKNIIIGHLDGNHGALYPRSSEFVDDGIPYISATDFLNGKIDFSSCKYLPRERCEKFQKGFAKNGDILFAHNATVGPVAKLETTLDYVMLSTTATYYRCDNDFLLSNFLKYVLQANYFVRQFTAVMSQSTRFQVPITAQRKFSIALPPTTAEQTIICTALSDMDDLLNSLSALIEKKKAIKQGAMQQLLKPNDGWVIKKLTDVVEYIHGKAHEQDIVEDGDFIVVNSKFISSEGNVVKYSNINNCPARKNDVLTVLSDLPNGKALAKCFFVEHDNLYAVNQRICIWRSRGSNPRFLFYLLNRHKYLLSLDDGVSQTHILNHHLEKFQLEVPRDIEEQKQIGRILFDMDDELTTLERSLTKYQLIKQGMTQELLTGKTRLI